MHASSESHTLLALGLGLTAAAANVLGGLSIVRRDWPRQYLKYFIALGAGFMLAAAFLEIIPESIHLAGQHALLLVLAGYFLVHFFEHTLAPHFHFGEETHLEEMTPQHAGYTALLGLMTHTFFDGVAIASGFLVSAWLGSVIFLAIVLHGAATLAGVLLMNLLRPAVGYALPISAGVTVYVAASDLMPEVNREPGARMALVVFLGAALMLALHRMFRL